MFGGYVLTAREIVLLMAPGFFLGLVLHEIAHACTATYFGDPTPKETGRLTLNPLPHLAPIGSILMPVLLIFVGTPIIFGWARPVTVHRDSMKHPRDLVWVAAAGPLTNMALALTCALLYRVLSPLLPVAGPISSRLIQMIMLACPINLALAFINLLPVPPFDGGRIIEGIFLSKRAHSILKRIEAGGVFFIIGLVLLDPLSVTEHFFQFLGGTSKSLLGVVL